MHIATQVIRRAEAIDAHLHNAATLTLTFAQRRRGRQRLRLDHGETEIGLSLDKGPPLRDGDVLVTDDASHVVIKAALEDVARVTAPVSWHLARAAYHLGNRHVPLEIAENFLQFEYDPVLVDMLHQVGGVITERYRAVFEPDIGAYGGGHRHGHDESFQEDYALAQHAYHAHDAGPDDGDALGDHQGHQDDANDSKPGHTGDSPDA
jgi:urease accessory protein